MDNAPLPHWLAPTAHQAIQPVEHHIDNPVDPSLVPPLIPTALLDPQERRRLSKELLDATFDSMFERVLTEITRGRTLKSIVAEDLRNIDYEAFWRWIKRDPRRMERYKEAKELRTEWWAGRIVEIAEADDALEDVARSKLKIDTYKWLMGADNRKTYGESKQIEVSTSISITAALEQARSRVAALPVVEEISDVDDPALPAPTD
jgi:acyl carrier protein phosphodiesterase